MASLLEKAFAKETLLASNGYDPFFLDVNTKVDHETALSASMKENLPKVEGNSKGILNYTNLSVLYDAQRRVPFFSAYNIDGSSKVKVTRTAFRPDPRIDLDIQLSQHGFYDLRTDITEFEIGHMAANNEMAWGSNAQLQAYQTFHFPNSAPQAEKLNTGIWKALERYIIDEAATLNRNRRISVFTGPLLRKDDPAYIRDPGFQIPLLFFKVIVFPTAKGLYTTGFMMSHEQKMIEQEMFVKLPVERGAIARTIEEPRFDDFKYKKVFQVSIPFLEQQTGLNFSWKDVMPVAVPNDKNQIQKIEKIKDSKDAEEAERELRRGCIPKMREAKEEITPREERTKNFKLNIILP